MLRLLLILLLPVMAHAAPEGYVYQFDSDELPQAVDELSNQVFNLQDDLDNLLLKDNDRLMQYVIDSRHLWSGADIAGYVAANGGDGSGSSRATIKLLTADEILTRGDLVLGSVIVNHADSARLITLPGVAAGDSGTVLNSYAQDITICPDASDIIVLDGVGLTAGWSITSTGAVTDILDLTALDASTIRADVLGGTWASDGNDTKCTDAPSSSWPALPGSYTTYDVDSGGGGTYASLFAAEAALPATFTDNIVITVASTDTTADSTIVNFYGFDTTASYELIIMPAAGNFHNGKWDDTIYRLVTTDDAISLNEDNITLRGLQVSAGLSAGNSAIRIRNLHANLMVDSCIIKDSDYGITLEGTDVAHSGHVVSNNIIYNMLLSGISFSNAVTWTDDNYIINNTIYNTNTNSNAWAGGIRARDTAENIIRNNIIIGSGNEDFFECVTEDHNISSDSTAIGSGSFTGKTATDVDFISVATGSEDFHIQSGSDAEGEGADETSRITWDVDGNSRTVDYDIGADQL